MGLNHRPTDYESLAEPSRINHLRASLFRNRLTFTPLHANTGGGMQIFAEQFAGVDQRTARRDLMLGSFISGSETM
jgi:hypothetical protein